MSHWNVVYNRFTFKFYGYSGLPTDLLAKARPFLTYDKAERAAAGLNRFNDRWVVVLVSASTSKIS